MERIRNKSLHMKFAVRLNGRLTSITLKKNLLALWFIFSEYRNFKIREFPFLANEFIRKCVAKWDKDDGKGFSDFVTEEMMAEILADADLAFYKAVRIELDYL